MNKEIIEIIDWKKMDNLVPAIIQSAIDNSVLMLGYIASLNEFCSNSMQLL